MGRIRDAWDALRGTPSKALFTGEDSAAGHAGGLMQVLSGTQAPRRGTRELLQAYKRLPYLHSISRRIASDVASVPWTIHATKGKRAKGLAASIRRAAGPMRNEMVRRAVKAGELVPVESHPFLDVLEHMNPALGGHDSWTVVQIHLDLIGQAPLVVESNGLGQPVELWPVSPHWIAETPTPAFPYYRASYGGWQRTFPEDAVLWLRVPDPENPYSRGTSYGEALGDELDVGELRARYAKNFFHNNATPDSVIALEGADFEAVKHVEQRLEDRHRGPRNVGRPYVTTGKLSIQQLQATWKDMQLSEQRSEDRRIVQEVLNFPPELMGVLENSNRSTINSAYYLYALGGIVPRKERQRAGLQPLLSRYDDRLVLGYENPVPEDKEAQQKHMVAVPSAFTINEHRAEGGATPLEGDEGSALFAPPAPASPFGAVALAADPPWTKALPRPVRKSEDAIRRALEALRPERLTTELEPLTESEFATWGQSVLDELGVNLRFDMRNPLVRETLAEAGRKIVSVTATTAEQLRARLQEGVMAGEGIRDLAKRVNEVFDHAEGYRSERIARTEVVGLSNAANLQAWGQSGVVDGKEWLSVRDGQTREEHRAMDGQQRDLAVPFESPDGHKAQVPGGFGVPELDCNCRCAGVPIVNDPSKAWDEDAKVARWKAYDKALLPWEERIKDAARRGFAQQRADVLHALGA